MKAIEIIEKNGKDLNAYTDAERETVKAYGWEAYGLGFADTVRKETQGPTDWVSLLDAYYL